MWTWVIILIVVWVLFLFAILKYNGLVKLKNNIKNAFADIDTQMKLRFDLIDNLVNTVKGYASHEKETLVNLTKARTNFMNASKPNEKLAADNMLSWTLKSLFAVSENYPDLKANQNFLDLQHQLEGTENRINVARVRYNEKIKIFNSSIRMFPFNFTNMMFFKYKPKEGFKSQQGADTAPKVTF